MRVLGLTMGLLGALVVAGSISGCGKRGGTGGGLPRRDSGVGAVDSGPRRDGEAEVDAPLVPVDTGTPRDTGSPPGDGGGMFPTLGCDPACLAMPGAMCCQSCGCGGATVQCTPRCPTGFRWDCEVMCCFDSTVFECFMGSSP